MKYALRLTAMIPMILASAATLAGEETVGDKVDDTLIHTKISGALVSHEVTGLNVEVNQGEVLLAGFVDSDDQRQSAIDLARNVKGVIGVADHMYIQQKERMPGTTLDDNVIEGKVKAELAADDRTSAIDIDVEVRDGNVLLSGFVDSMDEAEVAMKLAHKTEGVRDVLNGMEWRES